MPNAANEWNDFPVLKWVAGMGRSGNIAGQEISLLEGPMMKSLLSKLLLLSVVFGLAGAVTGCNTMRGAGEDIEGAGEAVQDAAE